MTGATVSDVLPAGVTFVSATDGATYDAGTNTVHFTTGTLAPGATASFQLTVAIDPAADRHARATRPRSARPPA